MKWTLGKKQFAVVSCMTNKIVILELYFRHNGSVKAQGTALNKSPNPETNTSKMPQIQGVKVAKTRTPANSKASAQPASPASIIKAQTQSLTQKLFHSIPRTPPTQDRRNSKK